MPTYAYKCLDCSHEFERFQKMSDEPVAECELCGAEVRKLLFPVAVHFKGSGFYTTDYARKSTLTANSGASNGSGESSGSCEKAAECGSGSSGKAECACAAAGKCA